MSLRDDLLAAAGIAQQNVGPAIKGVRHDHCELSERLERYADQMEPQFAPGDQVWLVELVSVKEREICPACKGGEKIMRDERDANIIHTAVDLDGRLYRCPGCDGKGGFERTRNEFQVTHTTVRQVTVHIGQRGPKASGTYYSVVRSRRSLVRSNEIHSTREAAEKESEKRNKHRRGEAT